VKVGRGVEPCGSLSIDGKVGGTQTMSPEKSKNIQRGEKKKLEEICAANEDRPKEFVKNQDRPEP